MSVGGSIGSVSIAGRTLAVAADSDSNRKLGGFENEVKPNGNGTVRIIKTRVAWMIGGVKLAIDDARGDQEFLQDVADGKNTSADADGNVAIVVNFASGFSYQGKGTITGELQGSSQDATGEVTLTGPGKLTQQ